MTPEFSRVTIDGISLHRMILHPADNQPAKAACIFNHGQGDYAERYLDVLHPFTERGIRCIVTDFQGHGRSSGKRGHVGCSEFIDQLIESNLKAAEGLPTGIAGHSMGGLLTLRHLALSVQKKLPNPEFCWVNAPLLNPRNGHPDWFVQIANILASVAPKVTIHTGVTPEMCREAPTGKLPKDPLSLGHQRVSMGWGSQLLKIAQFVHDTLPGNRSEVPFLYTQGNADVVCPPEIAASFFRQLKWPNKTFKLLPEMRHETFAEVERQILFDHIGEWLDSAYQLTSHDRNALP